MFYLFGEYIIRAGFYNNNSFDIYSLFWYANCIDLKNGKPERGFEYTVYVGFVVYTLILII